MTPAWLQFGVGGHLYVNAAPIQMIHDRWMSEWSALWASGVTRLKYRVEAAAGGAAKKTSSGRDARKSKRKQRDE